MKLMVTGAVVMLLLAGCNSPADPGNGESTPPSQPPPPAASGVQRATDAELSAVCDALDKTVTLPGDGTVKYNTEFNLKTSATNTPMCDIEPDGKYYDVATKVPVFGRAAFNYGRYTDTEMLQVRYGKYTPETVENVLTLDQVDPLTDEVPCAVEPCKDDVHGYQYNFRFEATMGSNISVDARYDFITTDVKGDKKAQYRKQAIEAFKAAMQAIADGLQ